MPTSPEGPELLLLVLDIWLLSRYVQKPRDTLFSLSLPFCSSIVVPFVLFFCLDAGLNSSVVPCPSFFLSFFLCLFLSFFLSHFFFFQVALGISTLLMVVPVHLASAHQVKKRNFIYLFIFHLFIYSFFKIYLFVYFFFSGWCFDFVEFDPLVDARAPPHP